VACWVGAQSQVNLARTSRKHAPIMMLPTENIKPKTKLFFSISSRRFAESVDGLNSSLAQSAGELWRCKAWTKKWPAQDIEGNSCYQIGAWF